LAFSKAFLLRRLSSALLSKPDAAETRLAGFEFCEGLPLPAVPTGAEPVCAAEVAAEARKMARGIIKEYRVLIMGSLKLVKIPKQSKNDCRDSELNRLLEREPWFCAARYRAGERMPEKLISICMSEYTYKGLTVKTRGVG
jgi:hypothetical protein